MAAAGITVSVDTTHDENWCELATLWDVNLKEKGVKLPKKNSKLGDAVLYLYINKGSFIHIDLIKKFVASKGHKMTGTDPLQVRHLSTQRGLYIVKEGRYHYKMVNMTEPIPGFIPTRRQTRVDETSWTTLKATYGNKCVNCGAVHGEPLRWDPTQTTILQQGHMDPRKDLTEDNCIPQCQFCNQQYKNKAIFNCRGFVIDFKKEGFR